MNYVQSWNDSQGPDQQARVNAPTVLGALVERGGTVQDVTPALIAQIIEARHRRSEFFPGDLFADPAWDLLLGLYAAYLRQHRVTIHTVTKRSRVPATTALRWIRELQDRGLLTRTADPLDGRRVFVGLSFEGAVAMSCYLQSCGLAPPRL